MTETETLKVKKLNVGDFYQEDFSFTQEAVNTFIKITGDSNPIHYDKDFAAKTIFKKPIVHGLLSSSIFSKIIGTNLPGDGSIYLTQDLKFLKPIYVEATYSAKVEITQIEGDRIYLDTIITEKESNKLALSGKAIVKYDMN